MDRETFIINYRNYFYEDSNSYWRWAERNNVIEWREGKTIVYREELTQLLDELQPDGWLPLDVYLLLLSALNDVVNPTQAMAQLVQSSSAVSVATADGISFIKSVYNLPEVFKTGPNKLGILQAIGSVCSPEFNAGIAGILIDAFKAGREDTFMKPYDGFDSESRMARTFALFSRCHLAFPTTESLLNHLQTGQTDVPEPLPAEALPEVEEQDLLTALERDSRTAGLAQLTRKIIAGVHIPREARDVSDQALGGYADLTNRGDFDKLLLSELAQDDDMLMARLANNEALYLRREGLPEQPIPQRRILLDVSLRMWGIPRVFSLAAALAFSLGDKRERIMDAYWMGGVEHGDIDLTSKAGVMEALAKLNPELHCGESLQPFFTQQAQQKGIQYVFITSAANWHDQAFQAWFGQNREQFTFVAIVDRTGELQIILYRLGRGRMIASPTFDLEALFTNKRHQSSTEVDSQDIAFLQKKSAPLFFPSPQFEPENTTGFSVEEVGSMGIDRMGRLLFWPDYNKGAIELKRNMPKRKYFWGFSKGNVGDYHFWLLHGGPKTVDSIIEIYFEFDNTINTHGIINYHDSLRIEEYVLENSIQNVSQAFFKGEIFYIDTLSFSDKNTYYYDVIGKKMLNDGKPSARPKELSYWQNPNACNHEFRQAIHRNYSLFHRVSSVWIDSLGDLKLGRQVLTFSNDEVLKFKLKRSDTLTIGAVEAEIQEPIPTYPGDRNLTIKPFIWPDGSQAFIDNRGLLHLKSSDPDIPELTVVLALDMQTACWSSDGMLGGSAYFHVNGKMAPNRYFKEMILQPFYNHIQANS